ncbi:alpha-amylase family glycosyl hydrolase [Sphingomonas adhaesiva]|uniref:alpha-amylase family glycosyl hydrolase n=1 Tax=Sphingomonas adhaesiva TaxID=28212 RepID=UPI000AFBE4D3|nr:alpha-amylase family glycosyl hydrolase [Sphingomonas adhaesiva]
MTIATPPSRDDAPFVEARLSAIAPRLRRQLQRLYGAAALEPLWDRTAAILRRAAAARAADLVALDTARVADPDWFVRPDMLGYSTYVDRFGGTVAGVEAHVDHLESLGVRYLHLLALLKARAGDSDGGFAVADYLAVEPRLGTMADVERLAARLRAGRISLCVDLALNHTADDHRWAQAARAGDPFYRDFYMVVSADEAAARDAELPQVFPTTAPGNFTPVPEMGGHVRTTFYPFQWDLNWRNPNVFLAMLDTMLTLANHGFEAFRLDSTAFLWKQDGTDCRNLPPSHYIVRALRAALDIAAPATLLKAEAIVPTAFVPPYFGADEGDGFEPECHLVYNNSLMVAGWVALAEQSAQLPHAIVAASGGLPRGANWLSYARCHDDIGWGAVLGDLAGIDPAPTQRLVAAARFLHGEGDSWARGEPFQSDGAALHGTNGTLASLAGLEAAQDDDAREAALRRIALVNALSIASGGLATLYMGDEAGLLNDRSYLADADHAHEGRWLHRPAMDWTARATPDARRIAGDIARLRAARIASGGAGAPRAIATAHPALLAIGCGTDTVFLNFSAAPVALDAAGHDRLTGATIADLPAWGMAWIEGEAA